MPPAVQNVVRDAVAKNSRRATYRLGPFSSSLPDSDDESESESESEPEPEPDLDSSSDCSSSFSSSLSLPAAQKREACAIMYFDSSGYALMQCSVALKLLVQIKSCEVPYHHAHHFWLCSKRDCNKTEVQTAELKAAKQTELRNLFVQLKSRVRPLQFLLLPNFNAQETRENAPRKRCRSSLKCRICQSQETECTLKTLIQHPSERW